MLTPLTDQTAGSIVC